MVTTEPVLCYSMYAVGYTTLYDCVSCNKFHHKVLTSGKSIIPLNGNASTVRQQMANTACRPLGLPKKREKRGEADFGGHRARSHSIGWRAGLRYWHAFSLSPSLHTIGENKRTANNVRGLNGYARYSYRGKYWLLICLHPQHEHLLQYKPIPVWTQPAHTATTTTHSNCFSANKQCIITDIT